MLIKVGYSTNNCTFFVMGYDMRARLIIGVASMNCEDGEREGREKKEKAQYAISARTPSRRLDVIGDGFHGNMGKPQ